MELLGKSCKYNVNAMETVASVGANSSFASGTVIFFSWIFSSCVVGSVRRRGRHRYGGSTVIIITFHK